MLLGLIVLTGLGLSVAGAHRPAHNRRSYGRRLQAARPPRADLASTTSSFVLAKPGTTVTRLSFSVVSARRPPRTTLPGFRRRAMTPRCGSWAITRITRTQDRLTHLIQLARIRRLEGVSCRWQIFGKFLN